MEWLRGKKTYITAIAIGVVTALHAAGKIDQATYETLLALLGAGGLAFLRLGVADVTSGRR
jgi:hypothetical protein